MNTEQLLSAITTPARNEPDSGIVKAAMYGMAIPGVIPMWSGEGNVPTPEIFTRPAIDSLLAGETFYTWQRGIPELREALARYHARNFDRAFSHENFFVTSGGMRPSSHRADGGGEGDEVIIPTLPGPIMQGPARSGSTPWRYLCIPQWALGLDLNRCSVPSRRESDSQLAIESVGWTATRELIACVTCRKRASGFWVMKSIRFFTARGETRAPSFLDICDDEEQLLLANTFSKNWAMTGWRVGWLQAPRALGPAIERIIQVNSSGTPAFLQKGCVAALDHGDEFLAQQVAKARSNRDLVVAKLREMPGIRFEVPQGAFYLFFAIDGMKDSAATTMRIIDEAKVGFAPGSTFGPGGEGHLRMCYLRDPAKLTEALDRFGNRALAVVGNLEYGY
jgi:aspartate/methionine/tyrosine aminotransferase